MTDELPEIPSEPKHPKEWPAHPAKAMVMTPQMVSWGGLIAFFTVVLVVVALPTTTFEPKPSKNWRALTAKEMKGRDLFLANGCVYCHSGFTRPQDVYADQYYVYARASEPGDYTGPGETPNLFGSARTGPDLSQAGGYHPNDWQWAHYANPRFTTPQSIMPRFDFLSAEQMDALVAFTQSRGGKLADLRMSHQNTMKELNIAGNNVAAPGEKGDRTDGYPAASAITNLLLIERGYWTSDNPLPVTEQNLMSGQQVYEQQCVSCHGEKGDGNGPGSTFLNPPPADFTSPDDAAHGSDTSPGSYYWRILRGVPGTGMENFGTRLTVEEIWQVVMYLKTIPKNGGLPGGRPKTSDYIQWVGYDGLFTWAECFWPTSKYFEAPTAAFGGPEGVGDVPGIVDPGEINPVYAVTLWELNHNARPCGTPGSETVNYADIMADAKAKGGDYAVQEKDQLPFIPASMLDPKKDLPSLARVWPKKNSAYKKE